MTATRMGLIGSSAGSGHHRSAKDAVVSARVGDCAHVAQMMMPSRTVATRKRGAGAGAATRQRARRPPTDQNPPCKNNDMDSPHRPVKGEPRPENGNKQPPRAISLGVCYFDNN